MKTVVRTYKTKAGTITKTYNYDINYSKTVLNAPKIKSAVFKTGRVKKSAWKEIENLEGSLDANLKLQINASARALIGEGATTLSASRLLASAKHDKILGALANTHVSLEELAERTNSTVEHLTDPNNWAGDIYTNAAGEQWEYRWDYDANVVFTKV